MAEQEPEHNIENQSGGMTAAQSPRGLERIWRDIRRPQDGGDYIVDYVTGVVTRFGCVGVMAFGGPFLINFIATGDINRALILFGVIATHTYYLARPLPNRNNYPSRSQTPLI